jgi:hypothetical protein
LFLYFGIPATGKKVKIAGTTIYRTIDGKIVEEHDEADFLGVFCQLGLLSQKLSPSFLKLTTPGECSPDYKLIFPNAEKPQHSKTAWA